MEGNIWDSLVYMGGYFQKCRKRIECDGADLDRLRARHSSSPNLCCKVVFEGRRGMDCYMSLVGRIGLFGNDHYWITSEVKFCI
jgi:hypothetical protein